MVIKGQFLERMTTFQSDGLSLEGLFHEGNGKGALGCVIAAPHPVFGGSMDSPTCAELAWAISRKGCPTLRFNYRGVGASHGRGHITQPDAQQEMSDLRHAARWLRDTAGGKRVHMAGYSMGAWLASYLAAEPEHLVERLVLVAPPTAVMPFDFKALSAAGVETLIIIPGEDRYVDHATLEEMLKLPKLRVERIPEANHFFMRGLATAGRLAAGHIADDDDASPTVRLEEDDGPPLELAR